MDQEIAAIRLYLRSRFLHVSNDWLEGCVSFFRSENATGYGRAQLEEFVLEQWKLADLREMEEVCLPPDLSAKAKTVLPGSYSLQVESMVDIGAPCYSQLQKIRNVATENLEVSETKTQTWEPRPTRMLKLVLCDGVQEVAGIEYRPIRKLDQALVPGCKVVVTGPVECRRGVLLLQEQNLVIIGGEVDSLLIPNALENLLARNLSLEENPQPYVGSLTPVETTCLPPVAEVATTRAVHQSPASLTIATRVAQPNSRPVAQVAPMAAHDFDEDVLHFEELDEIERRYQQEVDDIPDNMLDITDEVNFPEICPRGWNVGTRQPASSGRVGNARLPTSLGNWSSCSNEPKHLQARSCDVSANNCVLPVVTRINPVTTSKVHGLTNNPSCRNLNSQNADTNSAAFSTNSVGNLDGFEVDVFEESKYSSKTTTGAGEDGAHISLLEEDDELLLDISSQDLDASFLQVPDESASSSAKHIAPGTKLSAKHVTVNVCKKPVQQNQSKITSFITKNQTVGSVEKMRNPVFSTAALKRPPSSPVKKKFASPNRKESLQQKRCKTIGEAAGSYATVQNDQDGSTTSLFITDSLNSLGSRVANASGRANSKSISCDGPSETICGPGTSPCMVRKPFVYLRQLVSPAGTYTVKAFVLTLVSQLVLKKEGWHLQCKINDGSAVMEVTFSSIVLEKLIGFSPAEMSVLRQQMATNPAIKEKIKAALSDAQKKLVNLNCLLDVTFSRGSDMPSVTGIREVDSEHGKLLSRRLSALSRACGLEAGSV